MIADSTMARLLADGRSTWAREAQRVARMAEEAGHPLDDETIVLADVRDLMAMRLRLQRSLDRRLRWPH